MLAVLVGLPAAWVYYGPLPPRAQRVVDRFVAAAKEAIGLGTSASGRRAPVELRSTRPRRRSSARCSGASMQPAGCSRTALEPPPWPSKSGTAARAAAAVGRRGVRAGTVGRRTSQLFRFRCEMPLADGGHGDRAVRGDRGGSAGVDRAGGGRSVVVAGDARWRAVRADACADDSRAAMFVARIWRAMQRQFRSLAVRLEQPRGGAAAGRGRASRRRVESAPAGFGRRLRRVERRTGDDTRPAKLARLEAALFLAREPLSDEKTGGAGRFGRWYGSPRAWCGSWPGGCGGAAAPLQPVEVAHGVQLMTRPQLADWLAKVARPGGGTAAFGAGPGDAGGGGVSAAGDPGGHRGDSGGPVRRNPARVDGTRLIAYRRTERGVRAALLVRNDAQIFASFWPPPLGTIAASGSNS